jgi:hypothetical protein
MMAQVGWAKVCEILTADLPRDLGALDVRRFLLVIPGSLNARERVSRAREYFELAGMEQDEDEVICLCGLEAQFPSEGKEARPLARFRPGKLCVVTSALFIAVVAVGRFGFTLMHLQ